MRMLRHIRQAYESLRRSAGQARLNSYENLLGIDTEEACAKNDISLNRDMVPYEPTHYRRLQRILAAMKLTPEDTFIDLGCGKGRVVCSVARMRVRKIVGVELDAALADICERNLVRMKGAQSPVEIVRSDAVNYRFTDETAVFIFNPFGYRTLSSVIDNLARSLAARPRKLRIAYLNPLHRSLFDSRTWLAPARRVRWVDCLIWESR